MSRVAKPLFRKPPNDEQYIVCQCGSGHYVKASDCVVIPHKSPIPNEVLHNKCYEEVYGPLPRRK
jgi:hypothetical protein